MEFATLLLNNGVNSTDTFTHANWQTMSASITSWMPTDNSFFP